MKALFIGDSIDDYLTVVNFQNMKLPKMLQFGLISDSRDNHPAGAQKFRAAGVNDMLTFILDIHHVS